MAKKRTNKQDATVALVKRMIDKAIRKSAADFDQKLEDLRAELGKDAPPAMTTLPTVPHVNDPGGSEE